MRPFSEFLIRISVFCSSWTKRLITAHDHAAVQINVGDVDPVTGRYTGSFKTFAISGYVRQNVSTYTVCSTCPIGALLRSLTFAPFVSCHAG